MWRTPPSSRTRPSPRSRRARRRSGPRRRLPSRPGTTSPEPGMDPKSVRVLTPFLGGGFGGKSADRQAIEAARLAQITGKPVQVAWTRAEEFFFDAFDPACVVKIVSGIDRAGRISLWDYSVYAAGERGASLFYDIPNARVRSFGGSLYGPG